MAKQIFSQLPALEHTANLAARHGMKAEPHVTLQKIGNYRYPRTHKKKIVIDGVLCAVSIQRACWLTQPHRPDGIKLTQVHAQKGRVKKSTPKVLIFDLRLPRGAQGGIWSITRKEFFLNFPSGHANIPTGRHVYGPRSPVSWRLHHGGAALKKCIASVKQTEQ